MERPTLSPDPPEPSPASPANDRWEARPVAAGLLRAAILLAPLAVSSAVLLVLSHVWRAPNRDRGWWLLALAAVAVVVAFVVERAARRLLPLASLLRLTMLFPDRAPSRMHIARAAGTTGQQLDRLARSDDDTAQVAAEKVLALITALGDHDRKTRGHCERVRVYCDLLAEQLRLPRADRDRLRWASLLHDIGKLDIAPTILNKPAKLSNREFARIRLHPVIGAEIAAPLLPWLGEWGDGIVDHHERWDGRGYPDGRAGAEISRGGRIVGLVDSFETMTAARVYKKAMTTRSARTELAACAGTQFDPDYVRAFLAISLPRVLWAMGPLAFVVQLPFLRGLARLGTQASQLPLQGASTAGIAAAASVIGVAAPAVAVAHRHPHSHTHDTAAGANGVSGVSRTANGSSAAGSVQSVADNPGALSGGGPRSGAPRQRLGVPGTGGLGGPKGSGPVPGNGSNPGSGPTPGSGTGDPGSGGTPGGTGGGGSGGGPGLGLTLSSTTMYVVQDVSATLDLLSSTVADLDASTLSLTTKPSDGVATIGSDGNVTYRPNSGFSGVDSLSYQVCDLAGRCGTAAVTVNVLGPHQANSNYSGVDFSGMDLSGFDFTGATLRGTDFSGANLAGANFTNADLTDADLASASIRHVVVNGATLTGVDLSGVVGATAPQASALNLSVTIGRAVTVDVSKAVSDPDAPIDWSTLQITNSPNHGTVKITGPHTIVYTPGAGLLSTDQLTFSVDNVLTAGTSSTAHFVAVL